MPKDKRSGLYEADLMQICPLGAAGRNEFRHALGYHRRKGGITDHSMKERQSVWN
ncbi:hypothetical protein AALA98_05970 [Lachnospiraceae bacterium 45-W7]